MPRARNRLTGETVMERNLTGLRLELRQRQTAEAEAQRLAEKMNRRAGSDIWTGFVSTYTA